MTQDSLPIAHRVWAEPEATGKAKATKKRVTTRPTHVLVFDTETTTDRRQALTFGVWRFCRVDDDGPHCIDEGIVHADDLAETDPIGLEVLRRYVGHHRASTERHRPIRLLPRAEFVDKVFYPAAYRGRDRVVGFNLPFDLSRLAIGVTEARGANLGGFSLIFSQPKPDSEHRERKHRPRVVIKHLDSKGAFISFGKPMEPDEDDLIPEGSLDQRPDPTYAWRGRFVDLRTLAFSLTGEAYTLNGACKAFDCPGKADSGEHGEITEPYIDYCRQDVAATAALYEALIEEFELHPIDLEPERAYSPASLSKAYLAAMGIMPLLDRHPDFSREALGYAMAAFYGGRAECRIRRVPVPVALVDFTSMYPTVDALMDLHRLQMAKRIEVRVATDEVVELLGSTILADCFYPGVWPQLVGFALVEPDGDIFPVRAAYNGKTWGIGVNPITSSEPLWYSLADCVASKLLTGKSPRVLRAVRLVPVGQDSRLRSVRLRGTLEVDPMAHDPVVTMVEERQRVKRAKGLPVAERDRLSAALKIVANAGSYGIYSEFNPRERRKGVTTPVLVHGRNEPFSDRVASPEDPGHYCFPPFASCITGAARLMLAMLERCVTDLGGTYAFCDTDSMAIVSTRAGNPIHCPGGSERLSDGTEGVRALSSEEVGSIRERFTALNPYDRDAVPDLLKLEAEAHCLAISAKRYALYQLDEQGEPKFAPSHKLSQHGLGHFLNPTDRDSGDPDWIEALWRMVILEAHGRETKHPEWMRRPTMVRTTITSPHVLRAFRHINVGHPYPDQVKPFNFVLTAAGAKPPARVALGEPFRLVTPFETDPARWERAEYVDAHHPEAGPYPITIMDGRPGMARVDTFADVLAQYQTHPESKSLGPDGLPCSRGTVGVLRRRPVNVGAIILIGKESNRLEERSQGELSADDLDERITTYDDHDEWYRVVVPRLRDLKAKAVAEAVGMSERRVRDVLAGLALPHMKHRIALIRVAKNAGEPGP